MGRRQEQGCCGRASDSESRGAGGPLSSATARRLRLPSSSEEAEPDDLPASFPHALPSTVQARVSHTGHFTFCGSHIEESERKQVKSTFNDVFYQATCIQNITISMGIQCKKLLDILHPDFLPEACNSCVSLVLTAHLSVDQPHFRCSVRPAQSYCVAQSRFSDVSMFQNPLEQELANFFSKRHCKYFRLCRACGL